MKPKKDQWAKWDGNQLSLYENKDGEAVYIGSLTLPNLCVLAKLNKRIGIKRFRAYIRFIKDDIAEGGKRIDLLTT